MSRPIEDYGLIGDTVSGALVSTAGSIDWLCLPRFDSGACFASLLGDESNGHWTVGPADPHTATTRRYLENSLVLETTHTTPEAEVRVTDFMPMNESTVTVTRVIEGIRGSMRMRSLLRPVFDYGSEQPWWHDEGSLLTASSGPGGVVLDGDIPHEVTDEGALAEFTMKARRTVCLRIRWVPMNEQPGPAVPPEKSMKRTISWWNEWTRQCTYRGPYRDAVTRSLITIKGLSYSPSGGILAALTTSLPEIVGGSDNWDYRLCWVRDATFTLMALVEAGFKEEAIAWREWLLRAVAGKAEQMRTVYGIDGERLIPEYELPWLPGYDNSGPVRIGNLAGDQFQLDIYGELVDALHQATAHNVPPNEDAWKLQQHLMDYLESTWSSPDNGIWELRGDARHHVFSKVMAWAGVDRAIKTSEQRHIDAPIARWTKLRAKIHHDVCTRGFNAKMNSFTQTYGSTALDAALLLMAPVGFLPASDARMTGTLRAIEDRLMCDGFVWRKADNPEHTGKPSSPDDIAEEGAFLACSFWMADNYILQGRYDDAHRMVENVINIGNDIGLLAEEYDPRRRRMIGNFPQAFSHVPLVVTALNLAPTRGPSQRRGAPAGK